MKLNSPKVKRFIGLDTCVLILVSVIFSSCHSIRHILKEPLKEKGADYLFDNLKKNEVHYKFLSAKFSATLDYNNKKSSFSGILRIRYDSAIWVSITPVLGIEAARVLITDDTVRLINRFNKTYIKSDYNDLNTLLKAGFDFDMLESLLTGNDFTYYDIDKFKARIDNREYRLSTVNRQKIKRYVKKQSDNFKVLLQDIWLNPETFKITRTDINEIKQNRKLNVIYSDFIEVNKQLLPENIEFELMDKNPIKVTIKYSKISIDEQLSFPFKVPKGYEQFLIGN